MQVRYGDQTQKLVLVVVSGNGPSLLGRNWLKYIRLDWSNILAGRITKMKPLQTLLQCHQSLFSKDQGPIHPFTASLQVQQDATPQFFKPVQYPSQLRTPSTRNLISWNNSVPFHQLPTVNGRPLLCPYPKRRQVYLVKVTG